MKRIFSMLAVLAIIFVISVPLFAVSVSAADDDSIVGTWVIDNDIDNSMVSSTIFGKGFDMYFYGVTSSSGSTINKVHSTNGVIYLNPPTNQVRRFEFADSTDSYTSTIRLANSNSDYPNYMMTYYHTSSKDNEVYISPSSTYYELLNTIEIVNVDNVNASFLAVLTDWLEVNGTKLLPCDGSSCPATDVNMDNICDDCGMTFSVLRDYTPSDFPSNYPPVPSLGNPNARYYLYRVISSNITYIVAYPSTVTPTYDSTKQNGQLYFSESYGNYRLDKTNWEWVLSSDESPYTIGGNNSTSVENLYSSVQIKDEKGENFFPIPLWEKIQEVTQREIPNLRSIVLGTIQILLLCGVGLMASLMVLNLFGKVFKTYRH